MNMQFLRALYDYGVWANEKLFHAAAQLNDEQYRRRTSQGYQSVHDTFVHNLGADMRWFARWRGNPAPPFFNSGELGGLSDIVTRWRELAQQRQAYLSALTDPELEEQILWARSSERHSLPRWQAMLTAATHGVQHRSEVAAMLTDFGFSPGDLDFVWYCLQIDHKG